MYSKSVYSFRGFCAQVTSECFGSKSIVLVVGKENAYKMYLHRNTYPVQEYFHTLKDVIIA